MAKHPPRNLTPEQLRLYLDRRCDAGDVHAVRYDETGDVAFRADSDGVLLLANRGMLTGRVRGEKFFGLFLTTSVRAALRTINQCTANAFVRPNSVTINRGSKGRKTWVERLDRAACGVTGGPPKTLHLRRTA